MALTSGLALWCFTSPGSTAYPFIARDYSAVADSLQFTTTSPGGFADLSARLTVPNPFLPRPELALFSRVAVLAGDLCVWLGEITDSGAGMDDQGEYVKLTALGVGAGLRDDPQHIAYVAQTVQQMAIAALQTVTVTNANELPTIAADTSQLFPDNPAGTYSPAYDGRNVEEILSDLATFAGDYSWGTWAHPTQKDAYGYPLGRVVVHLRDAATTGYMASLLTRDVGAYEVTPSAERAYNAIELDYRTTAGAVAAASYVDSRLGIGRGQNLAAFRYRKFLKDVSSNSTIGAAQAATIANTYGALYQNVTNKVTATLYTVRDPSGIPQPLWVVQADQNLYLPDISQRGTAGGAGAIAVKPTAGVNQFYIVKTTYAEDSSGDAHLDLEMDNFFDTANLQIARLQLLSDTLARSGRTTGLIQALGAPIYGTAGATYAASGAGQTWGVDEAYPAAAYQAPTSITLTPISTTNIASGPTVSNITALGFTLTWTNTAAGTTAYHGSYATVGNCLLDVDAARGTFAHHCQGCGLTRRGLRLARDLTARYDEGTGQHGLMVACPCGRTEHFHCGLAADDEVEGEHNHAFRARQARLVRAAMRHPKVGLAAAVRP